MSKKSLSRWWPLWLGIGLVLASAGAIAGITAQGITAQGNSLMGNDLLAPDIKGVAIDSVDIRGTTSNSGVVAHTITRIPSMSTGDGNYISLASGSASQHYAVAHLVDADNNPAEDLDLFIADAFKDPIPNEFHNFDEQDNEDELYIVYFFHKWSGQWMSLCPYNPLTKSASAVAIHDDTMSHADQFYFACTATGVASKCMRNWGYRPWAQTTAYEYDGVLKTWVPKTFDLKEFYNSCKHAAMADYCQTGKSFTKTGTQVDLYDTQQIIWPNTIEAPWNKLDDPGSLWMNAQEYFIAKDDMAPGPYSALKQSALQRSRYAELSPVTECDDFGALDRLDHDHIEDGRWAALSKEVGTISVFSPTYCKHDEYTPGDALPWDCSPCTTQVCKSHPQCCGSAGVPDAWTAACAGYAGALCNDAGGQWAPGKVWPQNLPTDDQSIYPTALFGPGGAVLRADGVSGSSTSASITGWSCDPEWPGASVAIRFYSGGTFDGGGTLLGEARADQALTEPLASEVSAACDGPGLTHARHGFSFTLPVNQTGNVYVYAIDESTASGPAAPPTLLRNGVVQVPRCAHSEHVAGAALDAACSACATSVCNGDATCCSTAWTDACASAADTCAPGDSSASVNSRVFAALASGWIEAPTDGSYTFEASQQPSRLFVNGTTVLDWFTTSPGTTSGTITLQGGHRYSVRWDRLQTEPAATPGTLGLTWQPPGTIGQTAIPTANLYAIAPGGTTGLSGTYFQLPAFAGAVTTRPDPNIDINKDVNPPGATPMDLPSGYGPTKFSAIWDGEIIPSFTESYNFYVVGSGSAQLFIDGSAVTFPGPPASSPPPQGACGHDLCTEGPKLNSSCNACAASICAVDHYCCDGGYLSYYSFLPEWDARCIAEVSAYCAPYKCTAPDPPPPISPSQKSADVPLTAGVHYRLRLTYTNNTADKTIRLLWISSRQAKQPVPQFALQPPGPPDNTGSGLNVTYFSTKTELGVVKADKPIGSGFIADLSLTPTIGQLGMPLVDVLASPVDASSGQPAPPSVVSPRYGEEVSIVAVGDNVHITGIGGIGSGAVRISGGVAGDVIAPVSGSGDFEAFVPVALGTHNLTFTQQTYLGAPPCAAPPAALCADSKPLTWPITVSLQTAKAPTISQPVAPVANPPLNTVTVTGHAAGPGPVNITDLGPEPMAGLGTLTAGADGSFTGSITLDAGSTADPLKGWHKLVFDQGGGARSNAVFVSVGIDPPTVTFPRNGAEIDCTQPDPPTELHAFGKIPYPQVGEHTLGRLRVMEETGRTPLALVGAETTLGQAVPGQPIEFKTSYNPGPGRHVIYFFQAPDPTSQDPDVIAQHFRDYSRLANTPTSKIVVEVKPPRFQFPRGLAGVIGSRGVNGGIFLAAPPPNIPGVIPFNITGCPNAQNPFCAEPDADVNIRVGTRLYTTRAADDGTWKLDLPLDFGWNKVTFSQVLDSRVGGAWSESCPSNVIELGTSQAGAPVITVPANITVDATNPAGNQIIYDGVSAVTADGTPVTVDCNPVSGSIFPVGRTPVLCTAVDPVSGAVGSAEFRVTVVDPPPTILVSDVQLEADQPAGAELDTYPVIASDPMEPNLFLECLPTTPNFFLLDEVSPVMCTVTDQLDQSASAQFTVTVVDTTAPVLCPLADIKVAANSGTGAIVDYATCADDVVDGPVTPTCDHQSGSFFPFGNTIVTCTASDKHGNSSSGTFTVSVGDSTPPVLNLPTVVTAIATSRNGARVNYTVTATDNIDPNPTVKCTPPSGSQFPLGRTTVSARPRTSRATRARAPSWSR